MLDPDRDQARELLERELSTADYNRPESFIAKALNWFLERISGLIEIIPGSSGLSTLILGMVIAIVAVAIFFAIRGSRRSRRLTSPDTGPVLAEAGLSADDYRARAAAAARAGNWDAVLLDSYRAIAAATDERALLDELPGTTAHEIAVALRDPFPDRASDLLSAADTFDAVCYGDQHATQHQAERVRELDRVLAKARPVRVAG
ncbi:DUF4129 domain-containing protein [Ornithinimicrobium faecis]|uniref:DUF4129 domain-containing protein n=1 Tax=Ornithinimicrobium faecis TaxID=2934158 RepID=A0ABY4YPX7_9MICO|nr:DUF4129 domain-containing protein [Ornithinimicrobium sp. HY1793]USQ78758.1 DUF4129 domain-containing protein [Ornithinimicrobium sp. HY1793]